MKPFKVVLNLLVTLMFSAEILISIAAGFSGRPIYLAAIPVDLVIITLFWIQDFSFSKARKNLLKKSDSKSVKADQVSKMLEQLRWISFGVFVAIAGRAGLFVVISIMYGQYGYAVLHLAGMLIAIYSINKNNKDQKKQLTRLLGDKSRQLLEKVRIQQPATNPV